MQQMTRVLGNVISVCRIRSQIYASLCMVLGICVGALFSSQAMAADEMRCRSVDADVEFRVILQPTAQNTWVAETLFLLDPSMEPGRALRAWFKAQDGFLKTNESSILAMIDAKNPGTQKGALRIAGARLSSFALMELAIDFSYSQSLGSMRKYSAQATYTKTDHSVLHQDFDCLFAAGGPISDPL